MSHQGDDGLGALLFFGGLAAVGVAAHKSSKLEEEKGKTVQLSGTVASLEGRLRTTEQTLSAARAQLEEARSEIGQLEQENRSLKDHVDRLFAQNVNLTNELTTARQQNADQATQLSAKDAEIARLVCATETRADEISHRDARVAQLEAELRQLGHDVPRPAN